MTSPLAACCIVARNLMRALTPMVLISFVISGLLGCFGSSHTIRGVDQSATLADLSAPSSVEFLQPKAIDLSTVIDGYRNALSVIDDPKRREDILRRLALLELRVAEDAQIAQADKRPDELYSAPISRYRELLAKQISRDDNDQLLYPLAKAYDLSGDSELALAAFTRLVNDFPSSAFYSESQFRRGEILFTNQRYDEAKAAYHAVVVHAEDTPFLENAYYMKGWSQFKLGEYYSSMVTFSNVLDRIWVSTNDQVNNDINRDAYLTSVNKNDESLSEDIFRAVVLASVYEAGPATLENMLDEIGEKPYAAVLFDKLGRFYLTQKRYRDSAQAFAAFVGRYPADQKSPLFMQREIESYVEGKFPNDVRQKKKEFVTTYAVNGIYWTHSNFDSQQKLATQLDSYIIELATYHHASAQRLSKVKGASGSSDKVVEGHYRDAEHWYREWLRSFPVDERRPRHWQLLAETLLPLDRLDEAIIAFNYSAYETNTLNVVDVNNIDGVETSEDSIEGAAKKITLRADSAYSAWLIYEDLIDQRSASKNKSSPMPNKTTQSKINNFRRQKINDAQRFVASFADDNRSYAVEGATIKELLLLDDYDATIVVADHLISRLNDKPEVANKRSFTTKKLTTKPDRNIIERAALIEVALLSSAHATFALENYADAEQRYHRAIEMLSVSSQQKGDGRANNALLLGQTTDNYAASIYKQGEQYSNQGEMLAAATKFLEIPKRAPSSSLVATAIYDASALFYKAKSWKSAITAMEQFQVAYPSDARVLALPPRLLTAKQQVGDYLGAAAQAVAIYHRQQSLPDVTEVDTLNRRQSGEELARQALYTAAELYEKAQVNDQAIIRYRQYAHEFEQPMAERMEAMMKLSVLYLAANAHSKRDYWLEKMIVTHQQTKEKTQRSTYLAAFSSAELLVKKLPSYYAITLKAPIKNSLANKRSALESLVTRCEELSAYSIAEYTTLATQYMGEMYADFASSLLDSERPKNLDELEMEQYSILLEEQAYPFEEKAIELYKTNVELAWQGVRTPAVKDAYASLKKMLPALFDKPEIRPPLGVD